MKIEEVVRRALGIVKPTSGEREKLRRVAERALNLAKSTSSRFDGVTGISIEGSAAKDTWIRGRAEADIFIHFDPKIPKEELEKRIVELGSDVIRRLGGAPRLMYADHPYVEGLIDGVTVDIVACYDVEPPNWISATDRTPYHTRYVIENLKKGQEDEVRLLKGFMIGCGVYGAEIKVRGFSGYLTELLVLAYGSFLEVLRAAATWRPPTIIDIKQYYSSPEEVGELFRDSRLIVIDPVDRARNVAAAVSKTRLSEFLLASKIFLKKPSLKFFEKEEKEKVRASDVRKLSRERHFIYLFFKILEEKPPDVLWGELRHSGEGVKRALERLGFKVYRSGSWTDERRYCLLIFEVDRTSLPRYALHRGPPLYLRNAEEFVELWTRRGIGPWIDGDRAYVLRARDETRANKLLKNGIEQNEVAISRGLVDYVKSGKIGDDLEQLIKIAKKNDGLLKFLVGFLEARPSFLRR
ncbi:MAG: CCA tRNA nucleotidyltransferase [Nitrososphaerota archaeon]|nr:CCA tRNA nucleotidyltransferase [Nitrososphaerota archaeon]